MSNFADSPEWTCIFPGKGGLSWTRAWDFSGTKTEAEAEAARYANSVAVPLQLARHIREIEQRMVAAERDVRERSVEVARVSAILDYNGVPLIIEPPRADQLLEFFMYATVGCGGRFAEADCVR